MRKSWEKVGESKKIWEKFEKKVEKVGESWEKVGESWKKKLRKS